MAEVVLPLPSNSLHDNSQTLNFDKIATFIGGNGSGKSTILKSIFDQKLDSDQYQDYKIVCFSSGQNESYSKKFGDYLNQERGKRNALNLDCFYYDKSLSKLLIFLATSGNHNGLVRKFLKEADYVREGEFDEDESTELYLKVKVDRAYTNIVESALIDEEEGKEDVITSKGYHRTLQSFIQELIDSTYQFKSELSTSDVRLNQDVLSRVAFEKDEESFFDAKVMFFTQASDNDYFIKKNSLDLRFNIDGHVLYLEDLSDGEYQILFLYALIDLFDSDKTLFLLDEADSHLHYRNIDKLWTVLSNIQGLVITTTHLLDSIEKSGVSRIRVVENGQIKLKNDLGSLVRRLGDLSKIQNVRFQAISLFKNVVLMDDENDWEIFKLLALKKLAMTDKEKSAMESLFSEFVVVKCPSGFDGNQNNTFAKAKLEWSKAYVNFLYGQEHSNNNVFLICDRDDFHLANIGVNRCPLLLKDHGIEKNFGNVGIKRHLLSWRRREIKHYLLSYSGLIGAYGNVNELLDLTPMSQLIEGVTGDRKTNGDINSHICSLNSDVVKGLVGSIIDVPGGGFSIENAMLYINTIPAGEISDDIATMYKYLAENNE